MEPGAGRRAERGPDRPRSLPQIGGIRPRQVTAGGVPSGFPCSCFRLDGCGQRPRTVRRGRARGRLGCTPAVRLVEHGSVSLPLALNRVLLQERVAEDFPFYVVRIAKKDAVVTEPIFRELARTVSDSTPRLSCRCGDPINELDRIDFNCQVVKAPSSVPINGGCDVLGRMKHDRKRVLDRNDTRSLTAIRGVQGRSAFRFKDRKSRGEIGSRAFGVGNSQCDMLNRRWHRPMISA